MPEGELENFTPGDWENGKGLFFGERFGCARCHRARDEGGVIGPDLSNLVSRDPASVLRDIEQAAAALFSMTGKIGQYIRENDWLMSIKQRTGIPGGACEFDLPSYHFWLHRPAEDRIGQLAAWTGPLFPLRDGSAIILRILRESGKPQRLTAPLGTFQQMLGGKTAQMLRVRLDPAANCVPEISANKYVLNVRFLTQASEDPKPRAADWDVGFELTFCNL
jgi:cell division protein ZapD